MTIPLTPAVLVVIDHNSRLSILQDEGVQVVLVDERAEPEMAVLLPRKNQAQELLERIATKYPVSRDHDIAGAAVNTITQLFYHRIVVGQLVPKQGPAPFPEPVTKPFLEPGDEGYTI